MPDSIDHNIGDLMSQQDDIDRLARRLETNRQASARYAEKIQRLQIIWRENELEYHRAFSKIAAINNLRIGELGRLVIIEYVDRMPYGKE